MLSGLFIFRVEAPLLYFNVSNVYHHVWPEINNSTSIKAVIMDLSTSAYIDSSGAKFIKTMYLNLNSRGIIFKISDAHSEVRDILRIENEEELFGHISRRNSLQEVIAHTLTEIEMNDKSNKD
jgi:sulfate permease, SulP family